MNKNDPTVYERIYVIFQSCIHHWIKKNQSVFDTVFNMVRNNKTNLRLRLSVNIGIHAHLKYHTKPTCTGNGSLSFNFNTCSINIA